MVFYNKAKLARPCTGRDLEECCQSCPHRLRHILTGCSIEQLWSRVQQRFRTIYYITNNNKGIRRLFYRSIRVIKGSRCSRSFYALHPDNKELPSQKQFRQQCLKWLANIYQPNGRKIVEVIDVSKCLTRKEKYMFRMDAQKEVFCGHGPKLTYWASKWWDQYYQQAIKVDISTLYSLSCQPTKSSCTQEV